MAISNSLQDELNRLNENIDILSRRIQQLERTTMKRIIKKLLAPSEVHKIQLNNQTMQYYIDLCDYLPRNEDVKAILLSVMVVHNNHPYGHAYLGFNAYQQRSPADQKTNYFEQTYNCHGTAHQQELIIPWNNNENNQSKNLVIDVTMSLSDGDYSNDGVNGNYFQIKVTGYIV